MLAFFTVVHFKLAVFSMAILELSYCGYNWFTPAEFFSKCGLSGLGFIFNELRVRLLQKGKLSVCNSKLTWALVLHRFRHLFNVSCRAASGPGLCALWFCRPLENSKRCAGGKL